MKEVVLLVLVWCLLYKTLLSNGIGGKSRKRRFLVFPEGSTFSFAYCLTIAAPNPPSVGQLTEAFGIAVSYDLPNNTRNLDYYNFFNKRKPLPVMARRHRSTFYSKAEAVMKEFGLEGRECILRAVCEAAQQLYPGLGMIPELLRTILLFPSEKLEDNEPEEHYTYMEAYKSGVLNKNCPDMYPVCPVSLVNLILSLRPARTHAGNGLS